MAYFLRPYNFKTSVDGIQRACAYFFCEYKCMFGGLVSYVLFDLSRQERRLHTTNNLQQFDYHEYSPAATHYSKN